MECRVSVTFEYDVKAPETHHSPTIVATNLRTIAKKSIDAAKKEFPNRSWRSIVVLIERIDSTDSIETNESDSESDNISS